MTLHVLNSLCMPSGDRLSESRMRENRSYGSTRGTRDGFLPDLVPTLPSILWEYLSTVSKNAELYFGRELLTAIFAA